MLPNKRTIARNVGIFGGAKALSVLAALVRAKVAAVFIGTEGLGLSAIYNSVVTFVGNSSGLGLSFSAVKTLSETYAQGDNAQFRQVVVRLRVLGMLCALAGGVITLLLSPLFSWLFFNGFTEIFPLASLALMVVATILGGIEMAVLKACGKICFMTISLIAAAVVSVVVSVPFYTYMGVKGVIWAVVICGFAEGTITFFYGRKTIDTGYAFVRDLEVCSGIGGILASCKQIIVLGIAFLVGGIFASFAELAIQYYFTAMVSLSALGLYKAGYQLSIYYTGMIFTAVNNDFYPQLSAVNNNVEQRNMLVLRQIKVLLSITTPLVLLFIVLVPWLLPLLFDDTFMPVCRMVQYASFSIIIKSVTMPLNFMPLALGRSRDYLLLEGVFWFNLVVFVISGFMLDGFDGAGIGIFLCHVAELFYVYAFIKHFYRFTITIGKP